MVVPVVVGRLLLNDELTGASIPVVRVAGIALISLGVACLPGLALLGMLTYSAMVTAYLACIGVCGEWSGPLLWPAVLVHAVLTALLVKLWLASRTTTKTGNPITE